MYESKECRKAYRAYEQSEAGKEKRKEYNKANRKEESIHESIQSIRSGESKMKAYNQSEKRKAYQSEKGKAYMKAYTKNRRQMTQFINYTTFYVLASVNGSKAIGRPVELNSMSGVLIRTIRPSRKPVRRRYDLGKSR